MKLPGAKAARQSLRWLHSRFSPGALILGYHRVGQTECDPYGMHVSPQHFAEQLEVVRRRACPMHLDQVLEGLYHGRLPRRAVAVTFDDGYADMLQVALPLLERFEIPAMVFVASGYLGREFWWDELAHLMLRPGVCTTQWPREGLELPIAGPPDQRLGQVYQLLLRLTPDDREAMLDRLRVWAGPGTNGKGAGRCLTSDELVQLATHDLISVGAHSVTHPMLAAQPVSQQRWEVQESKARLEALLGRPLTAFSYPNGSLSAATRAIVQEFGFVYACSSDADVAQPGKDRFALPRFWMPDWGGDTFSRWLGRWICR